MGVMERSVPALILLTASLTLAGPSPSMHHFSPDGPELTSEGREPIVRRSHQDGPGITEGAPDHSGGDQGPSLGNSPGRQWAKLLLETIRGEAEDGTGPGRQAAQEEEELSVRVNALPADEDASDASPAVYAGSQ